MCMYDDIRTTYTKYVCIPVDLELRGAQVFLQVSFAENSLFYRALLQKRPIILTSY